MKEKIKEMFSTLDKAAQVMERSKAEDWSKTRFLLVGSRVKTISLDRSLRYTEKNWIHSWLGRRFFVYRAWTPLWSILLGDFCNLLVLLNNTATYTPFPQQEIKITSTLQELSATECIGLVDVYHKEQRISRVEWHLTLSCGVIRLSVTFPVALADLVETCVEDLDLIRYS